MPICKVLIYNITTRVRDVQHQHTCLRHACNWLQDSLMTSCLMMYQMF